MLIRKMAVSGLLIFAYSSCGAQDLSLLAGGMRASGIHDTTYAWQLDYRQGLNENLAFTLSWLNEGHVLHHHRDGQSAQIWARTNLLDRRLSLAAGVGPYFFYDTTGEGAGYMDKHGWGSISSLSATYYTKSGWIYEARANRVIAHTSINTTSMLFGIGYQLEHPSTPGVSVGDPPQTGKTTTNQVTFFLGQTIVNSFASQHDTARAIEYRHGVSPHFEWSLSWLNEGDARLIRRDGVIAQAWLVHGFFDNRFELGAGVGPYFSIDRYRAPQPGEASNITVSAIVTATAAVRVSPHVYLRTSWNRIASTYNRDTDVILMGLGYSF
ncbi:MAG: hypothetical protein ACYCZH_07050 [Sulfuriferula sp.]